MKVSESMGYSRKLQSFIKNSNIDAQILYLSKEVKTVEQAMHALGVSKDNIIKSLLFIDSLGEPYLVIIRGDQNVDTNKLTTATKRPVRMATPKEVLKYTGYPVGGVPPIAFDSPLRTIIDEKVLEKEVVYGGGGSVNALLKVSPKEIVKVLKPIIASVSS